MIKEDRIITRKNLKQLCVDFDLYTLGTSEEYEEMLKSAVFEGHLTTERIVEIAKNILEHSETDIELGSLCAEINRAAYTFFIEEEKEIAKEIDTYKAEYFLIIERRSNIQSETLLESCKKYRNFNSRNQKIY